MDRWACVESDRRISVISSQFCGLRIYSILSASIGTQWKCAIFVAIAAPAPQQNIHFSRSVSNTSWAIIMQAVSFVLIYHFIFFSRPRMIRLFSQRKLVQHSKQEWSSQMDSVLVAMISLADLCCEWANSVRKWDGFSVFISHSPSHLSLSVGLVRTSRAQPILQVWLWIEYDMAHNKTIHL